MAANQRREVEDVVEYLIAQAEADAELVAGYLKARGHQPRPRTTSTTPAVEADDSDQCRRARHFLVHLAVALRLLVWRRAGLDRHLPPDALTADEAFHAAANAATTEAPTSEPTSLARRMLAIRLRYFMHSSHRTLQREVAVDPAHAAEPEALLDQLADLLWRHRHLTREEE